MFKKILGFLTNDTETPATGNLYKTAKDGYKIYDGVPNFKFHQLLEEIISEIFDAHEGYFAIKLSTSLAFSNVKELNNEGKFALIQTIMERRKHLQIYFKKLGSSYTWDEPYRINSRTLEILKSLLSNVVKSLKEPSIGEVELLVELHTSQLKLFYITYPPFNFPHLPVISHIEALIEKQGLTEELKALLKKLMVKHDGYGTDEKKINSRIEDILSQKNSFDLVNDPLGNKVMRYIKSLDQKERTSMEALVGFLAETTASSPSGVWLKKAKSFAVEVGEEKVVQLFSDWLSFTILEAEDCYAKKGKRDLVNEKNAGFLRGMIWLSGGLNKKELNELLDALSLVCFKKIPEVGAVSVKTGNSCIYALSLPEGGEGIASLTKLRMKVKYPSVQKYIEKVIEQLAKSKGKHSYEIEEMAVPDFGLDKEFKVIKEVGEFSSCILLNSLAQTEISWINENGKEQKSVPVKIKEEFGKELKETKKLAKDISDILAAQKDRVEQQYFRPQKWNYTTWNKYYLEHPLVSFLAKKLIWYFKGEEKGEEGIWLKGKLVSVDYKEIDWITEDTEVTLWHPIGFDSNRILQWRDWMRENEIVQPFKQAFREVYILTDAEIRTNNYSNRFAAHILRQHQFAALCKARGWHYTLQGDWDSHNVPYKELPQWGLRADFWVESNIEDTNTTGVFNYVSTDQVRFYNADGQMELFNVPATILSEVMRDVDLFVGVASIGNDPNWQDSSNAQLNNYFQSYSVGDLTETAKTRKEALLRIIPKLTIGPRCTFTDKHLIVKGDIRTYKIHFGSGNIFMEPNDQYLCIVKDAKATQEKVFLPFEGDNLLSIILSKALLLAEDKKIKDSTILSQINR